MKDYLDPAITPLIAATMTIFFGMVTVYFRWLIGSFDRLESTIKDLSRATTSWLDSHEDLDQHRHEQNLLRFEKINIALTKLGANIDPHGPQKED